MYLFEKLLRVFGAEKPPAELLADNYTPRAQQMFLLAQQEAARLNHSAIETGHVLLGLIKLGQGVAFNVLKRKGLNLEAVWEEIERRIGRGTGLKTDAHIPFGPEVERLLVRGQKEAELLHHTYVGTEHVLLGILAEEGTAANVLKGFGLDVADIRREVLKEVDPNFSDGTDQQGSAAKPD